MMFYSILTIVVSGIISVTKCSLSEPPFVTFSKFNELEEIGTFDFPDQGFTTNSVRHMSARLDGKNYIPGSSYLQCKEKSISVPGSLECLAGFWKFVDTLSTLSYEKWIDPASDRDECDYTIAFSQCPTQAKSIVDQVASMDPNAMVDGDVGTVWAHPIQEGEDTKIDIDLHGTYTVVALGLQVETVPLRISVDISTNGGPMNTLVRFQQEECELESDITCLQYLSMNRNNLSIPWEFTSEEEVTGDTLHITLHGETSYGPYSTNYYIIRELTLLAKEVEVEPVTVDRRKTLRQRLIEYRDYHRRINQHEGM